MTTAPLPDDSRIVTWKRILTVLQARSGTKAHNNVGATDTLREILVKVLRSLNGV